MDDQMLDEFRHDFALLIEAGFVAVKQLDETSAKRLFQAAQLLRPESSAPEIGMGFIALNKLEVKDATAIFQAVIEREPDNHLAKTFLGICYLLVKAKRPEGEKLIAEARTQSTDSTVKNLCDVSLDWAEKDLKKGSKAPFFSKPVKEST